MTKNLFIVRPDDVMQDVLSNLAGKAVSCAVVAEDALPVGIITERDMARFLVENRDFSKLRARELMSSPLQTVPHDVTVLEAARIMRAGALLGCSADDTVGRHVDSIPAFRERSLIRAEDMSRIIGEYQRETSVFELEKEGNPRTIQANTSGIWEGTGRLFGFVLMLHDITEQKRVEEELAYMATHDSLTGLSNRAFFNDLMASRQSVPCGR